MRERGFTLMELLVAMTITLVVMGSVFTLLQMNQPVFQAQPEVTDMQQNVRVAMDFITQDVVMAGYNGGNYSNDGNGTRTNEPMAIYYDSLDPSHNNNDVIPVTAQGVQRFSDRLEVAYADPNVPSLKAVGPDDGSGTKGTGTPFTTVYNSSILWTNLADGTVCGATNPPPSPAAAFPNGSILYIFQGSMVQPFQLTLDGACNPNGIKLQHNPAAPSGMNLPGGFNGTFDPTQQPPPAVMKLNFMRYYLDTTDPNHPTLVRQNASNPGEGPLAVANDIFDFQVKYTCANPTVLNGLGQPCNEANVPPNQNVNGAGTPGNGNTIVKVKVILRGQPNSLQLRQNAGATALKYVRNFELTSDITPRNMTLSR